jgi:PAS domain S-box-containing protein
VGDVHDVEVILIRRDRQRVTVSVDGRRGQDEHGELRIHCALHDVTAARRADARVRRSEERYRTMFDESPISLWEEDFSGIRRHLDRLRALGVIDFEEHFRAHPEELADCIAAVRVVDVNRATLALYGADSRSQLLAGLGRIIGEEGREVYTLSSDPLRLALHWSVAPGAERSWSRVLISAIDITDRVRVEEALHESEARFERALRSAAIPMGISRRSDGVILDVNDVFLRELGFMRGEVVGRTVAELGIRGTQDGPQDVLAAIDSQGAIQGQDIRLRRRSGGFFDGVLSVVPLKVHGEDCLLLQVVDATSQRRTEELYRESQRRLAAVMDNVPGMVFQCCADSERTMLFVSDGCLELTGYEPFDLIGNRSLSYGGVIVEDDRESVLSTLREATDCGQRFRLSYRIRHSSGATRRVREQGRVAESSSEEALVLEGVIFDVSDSGDAQR